MVVYAERQDVLRVLGGTLDHVQKHFGVQLWKEAPLSPVTVDGNTFDMPDTLLERIDSEIESASSRLDGYILQAYKARPADPPAHLRTACARLAAYQSLANKGVISDFIQFLHDEAHSYMRDLSAGKLDLGIIEDRPHYRWPAAIVVTGVGGGGRRRSRRGRCR